MRQFLRFVQPLALLFPISACSAGNDSDNPTGTTTDGIMACGSDPKTQPDRCIDEQGAVHCKVHTGYAGDELALCDVDPEKGMLIHFGPNDYSNPDEVAKYTLPPSGEEEFCLRVNTTNTTQKFFNAYHGRMRPNSHHLIVTMPGTHVADDSAPWVCGPQVVDRWLFGSQDPQIDVGLGSDPSLPQPGDPDYGLAHDIPPNQTLMMDFHNVNTTDHTELREAWTVLQYTNPEDVLVRADLIAFYNIGISIPPLAHVVTSRVRCEPPTDSSGAQQPVYVNVMTGHAHQRMQRFSVWHDRPDGTHDLVYETHDWYEPGNALYRNRVQNPVLPVASGSAWGATSGYLQVLPGEALSFECEYQNDLNQTVTIGETSKDEMCNVFGNYFPTAGGMWNCFGS